MPNITLNNYSSIGQWFFIVTIIAGVLIDNNMGNSVIFVGIIVYCLSSIIGYYKMQTLFIGVIELRPDASKNLKIFWLLTYLSLIILSAYGLIYGYKNT
jgi:hypothetical protein